MNELAIVLDANSRLHLYEQIYEYIIKEIKAGELLAGEKLPSTRFLAEYLQISRSTVELAYEQLVSEGYLESKPYRGYFVCKLEELFQMERKVHKSFSKKEEPKTEYLYDFSPNGVEANGFPYSVWKSIQKNTLNSNQNKLFESGLSKGEKELRISISRYLHASRGVSCDFEQVIIGAGNDYLLMLLEKIMGANRRIAMENQTYKRAYHIFKSCGYDIKTIDMDEFGMNPVTLRRREADIAYVMPSHQFPTGIVMPIGRRMELLSWANEKENRYLIEDDYDSEFRYKGKPIPALQSSDHNGKVIYMGTFSKAIAPAIRISYMVLPRELLKEYEKNASFYSSTVSRIDQAVLHTFLNEGYFERHLNKMRKIYKAKHDIIISELKCLEPLFSISGENAGLHILLHYKGNQTEEELTKKAKEIGVKVYPISEYRIKEGKRKGNPIFILGYAGLSENRIKEGIRLLKKAWL